MIGSKGKLIKSIDLVDEFDDDPSKSFIFIYGDEGSSTTSLAMSISEAIDPQKKVYVLNTEAPHNETGIIKKHFPEGYDNGRFVLPASKETGSIIPITSRDEFYNFTEKMEAADDVGAVVVDAIDTLRLILFSDYAKNINFLMTAWVEADNDIIDFFMKSLKKQVPIVIVMKEKEKTEVTNKGKIEVKRFEDEDGNPVIIPTVDNKRIQRWASIRIKTLDIGKYEVMKSKGEVEKGAVFDFTWDKKTKEKGGVWLPNLLELMEVDIGG